MKLHLLPFAPLLACADPVRNPPTDGSITQGGKEGRAEFTLGKALTCKTEQR